MSHPYPQFEHDEPTWPEDDTSWWQQQDQEMNEALKEVDRAKERTD